jgi:hypothetical protein
MGIRVTKGFVVLVAAATLAAGPLLGGEAFAGKRKSKIKCTINGEVFKTNTLGGGAAGGYEDPINVITIVGGRAKHHGHTAASLTIDVRVFGIVISSVPDLTTATFPLTLPAEDTTSDYSKNVTKGPNLVETKAYNGQGLIVTITDFDGTRLKGTAEGTIPAIAGTDTPATVENCKFSVLPPAN